MNIIDKAIEILQNEGWIRGNYVKAEGYCMMGALSMAAKRNALLSNQHQPAVGVIHHQIKLRRPDGQCNAITVYNDRVAADLDEVMEVLKLASEEFDLGRSLQD